MEEEAALKLFRSGLAKTSMSITLEFNDDSGETQIIFVLGDDLNKFDLSRHTEVVVFKADGELVTKQSVLDHVECVLGLRQPMKND